jgi:long-chain fatty acid transport protein
MIRNFDVHLSSGAMLPNPQHWNNVVSVSLGTQYTWLHLPRHEDWELALRAGYMHSGSAVPDANFDPAIIDLKSNIFGAGIGLLCRRNGKFLNLVSCGGRKDAPETRAIGLDLAYNVILFEPRTVQGNPNPNVDGTYEAITHVGSINFRLNF